MTHHHGQQALAGIHSFCNHEQHHSPGNRFGRIFNLPPLYIKSTELAALGAKGGPMDGGTNGDRTNSVAVGQVFFGQFIDHDITLDVTSSFSENTQAQAVPNVRTPTLDLDCIYGQGPEADPFLYHQSGDYAGIKLLTGKDGTAADQSPDLAENDLVRSSHGSAIIGDPRNDENRIISQLQLAMIRFHNNVAETLHNAPGNTLEGGELFEHTRETVTWH